MKINLPTGREGDASTLRGVWSSGAEVVHFAIHALADIRQPRALSETQRAWLAPKAGADEAQQIRRRITALAHGFYTQ